MTKDRLRIAVPGRSLVLVAGVPGAGKSTLLATVPPSPEVAVLDSDAHRAALAGPLPGLPYRWYRPLVHLRHRLAVLAAACSAVPTVVVHLPATDARTRAAVARLATLTRRSAHLVWLHVDPDDALRGQVERGRLIPPASFAQHTRRAAQVPPTLASAVDLRWCSVTVTDRSGAARGLALDPGHRIGAQAQ